MVSTAHIHWDPEYSDVKLIQTMMLISELKKIIEETIQNYKLGNTDINTIPLILCGDLNSLPDSGKYSRHSDNVSLTLIYFLIQVNTIDIVIIPPKPEFTSWFR